MVEFKEALLSQLDVLFNGIPKYFKESPISTFFLIFLLVELCLNIVKRIFIWQEKKKEVSNQPCECFIIDEKGQDCCHPLYREYFKQNGNSCAECKGKSFELTDVQAEKRIVSGKTWKKVIFISASYGKSLLPYITFIYTLSVAIFETVK